VTSPVAIVAGLSAGVAMITGQRYLMDVSVLA
jgi:hypothetical protein